MGCSIEERWKPLVKYFYYLGISKEGMKRILVVKPILYCIDLEKTIAPKVFYMNFLLDTMNYKPADYTNSDSLVLFKRLDFSRTWVFRMRQLETC